MKFRKEFGDLVVKCFHNDWKYVIHNKGKGNCAIGLEQDLSFNILNNLEKLIPEDETNLFEMVGLSLKPHTTISELLRLNAIVIKTIGEEIIFLSQEKDDMQVTLHRAFRSSHIYITAPVEDFQTASNSMWELRKNRSKIEDFKFNLTTAQMNNLYEKYPVLKYNPETEISPFVWYDIYKEESK